MAQTRGRLILIPQYPTPLRYQEWWLNHLANGYMNHFDSVLVPTLGWFQNYGKDVDQGGFSSSKEALKYEAEQIKIYMDQPLLEDDVLLLCDLSYPGLFAHTLFHKKPQRCFAICHATSLNFGDIFSEQRLQKYPIERAVSGLFDGVFVASWYHKDKLGPHWGNTSVHRLPHPPVTSLAPNTLVLPQEDRIRRFASVARIHYQKVDVNLETEFEQKMGSPIKRFANFPFERNWSSYYQFLAESRFLIITSREETYGYQVIDALSVGTIPIAPNCCSYPELLPKECLYEPGSVSSMVEAAYRMEAINKCPLLKEDTFFQDTARIMLSDE